MAPVVRVVEMFVADAIRCEHERLDEAPRCRSDQPARIHADVEVAPDHQPGYIASDGQNASGRRQHSLDPMRREEDGGLGLQRVLASE